MFTDPKTLWNSKLKILCCFSSLCDYDYLIFFCACSSIAAVWLHMKEPEINLSVWDHWLYKFLWKLTRHDNSNFDKIIASTAILCHWLSHRNYFDRRYFLFIYFNRVVSIALQHYNNGQFKMFKNDHLYI